MDNSAVRQKMCYEKKRYKNECEAIRACIRASRTFGVMRPYKCPYCEGWHTTHSRAE